MNIVFEDNHLLIVNKKSGEIVQGDATGDQPLIDKAKDYIKQKYNKPGNVYIGLPHRLDRPTSGLVILSKTSKALTRLNKMFASTDQVLKTYWAVVGQKPPKTQDTLNNYLKKNAKQNKSYVYQKQVEGAKLAKLDYHHIGSIDNYHLLEIQLHTGRHHQIRAQLANIGLTIKGDLKYGAPRSNKNKGIHLHARKLEFTHPVSKELMTIVAPTPDEPVWNAFREVVG